MGHSLRDARVLGLSLLYEHTSKEKESDREIWGPLHYAASDSHPCIASMPQLFPQTFSNHNTPRWPHFLCLCGLFSVKALTLGQDLLNLQWLIVAIVVAQQRLSRQPLPRFTTGRAPWVPLAGPVCSAFLLALSYFCPFSHCSLVCVHQRPRSYCAANSVGLALVTGYSAGRVGHIWRELPICADVFKCNQKSPFRLFVFRLPSVPQLSRWANRHSELGFGIDCLLLQPKVTDIALESHGWEHPPACPRHTDALSEILHGEQELMVFSTWLPCASSASLWVARGLV